MNSIEERVEADGYGGLEPILFYAPKDANGWMSNFSKHPLWAINPFTGEYQEYRTGEHRYQAMKATTAYDHDLVARAPSPGLSKDLGRQILLRDAWGNSYGDLCWYVMMEVVMAKLMNNDSLIPKLLATGEQPIYEDSPVDDIWGVRFQNCYKGKNLLGRCFMQARVQLAAGEVA
jgi:ribA/ribD-fused uncharacterized protein